MLLLLGGCAAPQREGPVEPKPDLGALWDFSDPAGSEGRFREAVAAGGDDAGYRAEALTQLARSQGLQRRFEEADRTLDEAEGLVTDATPRARVRLHLERGRVVNTSGHPEGSRALFRKALEVAERAGEEDLAVDAAHMLGLVTAGEESLSWNRRAMEMAEAAADPRAKGWLGPLYNNTGWTLHTAGRYAEALPLFEKARDWYASRGNPGDARSGRWAVARCHRSLGRTGEALAEQRALLAETGAAGEPDGFVHEETAECLLALGRAEEARPHFARAFDLLWKNAQFAADEPARLARLRELAGPK